MYVVTENAFDTVIEEIERVVIDLYKETYEIFGYSLGETNNKPKYKNYLKNDPIMFAKKGSNPFYDDSENSYIDPITGEQVVDNIPMDDVGISEGMLNFICMQETGKQFGYKMSDRDLNGYDLHDANGHKTYGYGLLYHPETNNFMDKTKSQWTQSELESLFKLHAVKMSKHVDSWADKNGIKLNQNQKDAIVSACYNFGPGFLNKPICKSIAQNPNDSSIRNMWEHLSDAQGRRYPGLIRRRHAEAKWYFEGHAS